MATLATPVSEAQWRFYDEHGYVKLGKVVPDGMLSVLRQRIDDIMLGKADIDYSRLMMQLDSTTGRYDDIGAQTFGSKGKTIRYRKIQNLDRDPVIMDFIRQPVFDSACRRIYGNDEPIASFRTMFFNKPPAPAGEKKTGGTALPWHQDRWVHLDRDPLLTVWTALDKADRSTGCVWIIPGSHKFGVINKEHPSGFLTPAQHPIYCPEHKAMPLELAPGEVALLHNWTIHRSGVNTSKETARRALSVNYMSARTQVVHHEGDRQVGAGTGHAEGSDEFPVIFSRAPKSRL